MRRAEPDIYEQCIFHGVGYLVFCRCVHACRKHVVQHVQPKRESGFNFPRQYVTP